MTNPISLPMSMDLKRKAHTVPAETKNIRLCLDDVVDYNSVNLQINPSQSEEEVEISNPDFSSDIIQKERVAIVRRRFIHIKRQARMKGISN